MSRAIGGPLSASLSDGFPRQENRRLPIRKRYPQSRKHAREKSGQLAFKDHWKQRIV